MVSLCQVFVIVLVLPRVPTASSEGTPNECDYQKCSCCPGLRPEGGGKELDKHGICHYYCARDTIGNRFCGDGPDYLEGYDCRNMANCNSKTNIILITFQI